MGGARLWRERGALRVGVGVLLGSMVVVSSAAANRPIEPQSVAWLSLAGDDTARRQYSLVPRDSPVVLLPLAVRGSDGAWINWDTVQFEYAPLTVDGDPDGELTGAGPGGARIDGFAWTPAVDREPGRTHTARLASGRVTLAAADYSQSLSNYEESTFEFSYMDGTSADFLPSVELTPLFIHSPGYSSVGETCCEVVATQCANGSSCHQCWDLEGSLAVWGAWDGPGLPYLTLSLRPALGNLVSSVTSGGFQITQRGEYCLEGTATTVFDESTTVTACGTPPEPPVHEASGLQPVFADTCRVLPADTYPMTTLVAARGETEEQARQLLSQPLPLPPGSFDESATHAMLPGCATAVRTSGHPGWLSRLGVLVLLGLLIRRRH